MGAIAMPLRRLIIPASMACLLVACGGGSSSGGAGGASVSGSSGGGAASTYTLSGAVQLSVVNPLPGGLPAGLVVNDGAQALDVAAGSTSFAFSNGLSSGTSYTVSVAASPAGLNCAASNNSGTVATSNISNVVVTCSDAAYTVGGNITGLTRSGLVLTDNGTDRVSPPSGATGFTFATPVMFGAAYSVAVQTQPVGETCSVADGSGTMGAGDVTRIAVTCNANAYPVGGTITGLTTAGLVLANGADTIQVAPGATRFTFTNPIAYGGSYSVTVQTQPTASNCTVANGRGTATAAVNNVQVSCAAATYSISGTVSPASIGAGSTVTLSGTVSATTTADASGNYSFTGLPDGSYAVAVSQSGYHFNPSSQAMSINGASISAVNFSAVVAVATYAISGSISPASIGAGSLVTLGGAASMTTTADSSGNFGFTGLSAGMYTVTPSAAAVTFTPTSSSVSISNASVSGVNFTAASSTNVIFFDDFTGSALGSAWTVISRHGEYVQGETECNVPQMVSVANSLLTITTEAQSATCGDFNVDGSVRHAPSSWPYITGDVQWTNFNFTYGTVTVRAKIPPQNTGTWPAVWFLGTNCQNTNPYTADTGYLTCPAYLATGYAEIDMVECFQSTWCQLALNTPGGPYTCTWNQSPIDNNWHTFVMTWSSGSITETIDGVGTGCSFSGSNVPSTAQFMLIQTQTGGSGGTPNNALLPATLQIDFVRVTQP